MSILQQIVDILDRAIGKAGDPTQDSTSIILMIIVIAGAFLMYYGMKARNKLGTQQAATSKSDIAQREQQARQDFLERESRLRADYERQLALIADLNDRYNDALNSVNTTLGAFNKSFGEINESIRQYNHIVDGVRTTLDRNNVIIERNNEIFERVLPSFASTQTRRRTPPNVKQ